MKEIKKYDEIICVCTGKKCKKNGAKEIYRFFRKSIRTEKNTAKILLLRTKCMDQCNQGPNVMMGNKLFSHFNIKNV
jgi:NADH:ubiquinone oxidoreductase subunit E